jgi:hypothetical protein
MVVFLLLLAFAGIIPSRLNTVNSHCNEDEAWTPAGISSNMLTFQGLPQCHPVCYM